MFKIKDCDLENIIDDAKDYAFAKGIAMRPRDLSNDVRIFIPFCLLPSPFPQEEFQLAKSVQKDMNYLLHQVAHDRDFLVDCLSSTAKVDEFTCKILQIYETVLEEGIVQPLNLGLFRCDYMLNVNSSGIITGIKQVENNTIASGLAGISPKVRDLHRFVLYKIGMPHAECELPENRAIVNLARGIISAWEAYGKKESVVIFVVEDVTYNIFDQRDLEYAIWEVEKDIRVLRCRFRDLRIATLKHQCLFIGDSEVAVVYYRYGYSPEHYSTQDWEVRLLIERSLAIKCPSAAYHLAGTKKVQLKLTMPGALEKYFSNERIVKTIRQLFMAQHSLEMNDEGDRAVSLGIIDPDSYVLKPEREGGGNNIYGKNLKDVLETIGSTDARQAYILMGRINPPTHTNYIIRRDTTTAMSQVTNELGIFGVILGSKDKVLLNYEAGHLLRTKENNLNEGGVSSGFGGLDSPYLT